MKVVLFGATGMVGEGALLECLDHGDVEQVLAIVRRPMGRTHDKLTELIHTDFSDYSAVEDQLTGFDACLFCLGISSAGISEADYRRVTYEFAVAAGEVLVRLNPGMRMVFISGAGANTNGRAMWARVKGETEDALAAMPWKSAHSLRPAMIQPLRGITHRTPSFRIFLSLFGWAFGLLRPVLPGVVTTTTILGQALIRVARDGHEQGILESAEINAIGAD